MTLNTSFAKNIFSVLRSLENSKTSLSKLVKNNTEKALSSIDEQVKHFFTLSQYHYVSEKGVEAVTENGEQYGATFLLEYFADEYELNLIKNLMETINKTAQLAEWYELECTQNLGKQIYYLCNSTIRNQKSRYFAVKVNTQVGELLIPSVATYETQNNDFEHLEQRLAQTISQGEYTANYQDMGFKALDGTIVLPGETQEITFEQQQSMQACLIAHYNAKTLASTNQDSVARYICDMTSLST